MDATRDMQASNKMERRPGLGRENAMDVGGAASVWATLGETCGSHLPPDITMTIFVPLFFIVMLLLMLVKK